jgi:hypothetical protein
LRIYRTNYSENCEKLLPLFQEHWKEIGMKGSDITDLNLNDEVYRSLEQYGMYLAVCLDDDEGNTIGYLSVTLYEHHHHKGQKFASTDCFYIDKKHRGIRTYRAVCDMFKLAERILKDEFNVKYFQITFSVKNDLSKLATNLGFEESERMFVKKL